MADKDTNTNKHIKIGVLNLFSFKTPISSRLCDRRRGGNGAEEWSGVSASEWNRGAALAAERCNERAKRCNERAGGSIKNSAAATNTT